ncbi:hypothetical protein, partial [Haemophilus parainfluenzae]|uniref:hypothetical protein n=1 Tax=Haemophilus parainfluenzae TaxID=729 RepID=UPI001CEC7E0F
FPLLSDQSENLLCAPIAIVIAIEMAVGNPIEAGLTTGVGNDLTASGRQANANMLIMLGNDHIAGLGLFKGDTLSPTGL